jgi:hypothetical protein
MYRIVLCKDYNAKREVAHQWWIVQCYKKKWWTFGKKMWFTETEGFGDYCSPLKFFSEKEAFDYIGRMNQNVPKETVIQEPVCNYLGK